MLRGNQHGGCEYDDLQNWIDMTSHENPLLRRVVAYLTRVNLACTLRFAQFSSQ